jgi:ferredoxin
MVGLTFSPAMDVTQKCVRRRFRRAACRACVDACPAQVFSITGTGLSVDESRCIKCGDCLFVCPAEAIVGVTAPKRSLCGDTLIGPFNGKGPTVAELLLWHAQYGVRAVSIDAERHAEWMVALAGLYLVLRRRGEPGWTFTPRRNNEINLARRSLIHVPQKGVTACSVVPGPRQLRMAFPGFSQSDTVLSPQKCDLCGACWRSCAESAIRFEKGTFIVEAARCTGCGGCEAVCQHNALEVIQKDAPAQITARQTYAATCVSCQRAFWSFKPQEKQCSLCLRHAHGMRNPGCC